MNVHMHRIIFLSLCLFSLSTYADNVCVTIDVGDTKPDDSLYPNMASEVEDHMSWFEVHHGAVTCFDLNKQYYMQYYLYQRPGNQIWYGTKCKYIPKSEDQGKTLVYKGVNGSSICPVVETSPRQ